MTFRLSYMAALFGSTLLVANAAHTAERYPLGVIDLKRSPLAVEIPYWQFTLSPDSGATLTRLTEENIDRQLILRVDGKEISRAWVHEPIRGETFNVTGAELDDPTVQRLRSGEADLTIEIAPQ